MGRVRLTVCSGLCASTLRADGSRIGAVPLVSGEVLGEEWEVCQGGGKGALLKLQSARFWHR